MSKPHGEECTFDSLDLEKREDEAFIKAGQDAARLAKAHGQKLILGRNGVVVHVDPDEVLAQLDKLPRR